VLPMKGFQILFRNRQMLWATTVSDIRGRYAGTMFGLAWMAIYPILFLGVYGVVYTMIFQVRIGELATVDYVLVIFAGLIPFLGLAEALVRGVGSVTSNKALIKNTLYPVELLPVKAVFVGSVAMIVGLLLLLVVVWIRGAIHWSQLFIPVILLLQLIFTIGLVWLLATLNVFFRDLGQIISVLILLLMLASPIAYTTDMVPGNLQPFLLVNPLHYLILLYRHCVLEGDIPVDYLLRFFLIAMAMFWAGYHFLARLKEVFAEHV